MHKISAAQANQMAIAIQGKPESDGQRLVDELVADGYEAERGPEGHWVQGRWTAPYAEWTIWDGDEEITGITCKWSPETQAAIDRERQERSM